MKTYLVYALDYRGVIAAAPKFVDFESDKELFERLAAVGNLTSLEIWDARRLVARLLPKWQSATEGSIARV